MDVIVAEQATVQRAPVAGVQQVDLAIPVRTRKRRPIRRKGAAAARIAATAKC
jgi:hypothetical protein